MQNAQLHQQPSEGRLKRVRQDETYAVMTPPQKAPAFGYADTPLARPPYSMQNMAAMSQTDMLQQHQQAQQQMMMYQQMQYDVHHPQQWLQNPHFPMGTPMNSAMMTPDCSPPDLFSATPSTHGTNNNSQMESPESGMGSSTECSPETDNQHTRSSHKKELFTVQGRLCQVGSLRPYDVTKAEIERRLSHPECMNSSALASMLRKAKTKNSGTVMRKELEDIGVKLPPNKRKSRKSTAFSALVEAESINASKDLNSIVNSDSVDYPTDKLAQCMATGLVPTMTMEQRKQMLQHTFMFMRELSTLFDLVRVELPNSAPLAPGETPPPFNEGMQNASALSHGFVIMNQQTWAVQFAEIARQGYAMIEMQQRQMAKKHM